MSELETRGQAIERIVREAHRAPIRRGRYSLAQLNACIYYAVKCPRRYV